MMALRALQSVYGQNLGFDIELPELKTVDYLEDGRVKVTLTHVWSNLQSISHRKMMGEYLLYASGKLPFGELPSKTKASFKSV